MTDQNLREAIAAVQHEIWAHWMRYQFSQGYPDARHPGCLIVPAEKVERWTRQMNTPYSALTEGEKESDREQADKVLDVIKDITPADAIKIYKDGDQWCALDGINLQEGTAGFGYTPFEALRAFLEEEALADLQQDKNTEGIG